MVTWLLRVLSAAGLLGSAAIHLWLWFDGFRDIAVVGVLFLINAAAGVALGIAVLVWRHWLPAFGTAGFGLATLIAYVLSVTVGLFGVREQFDTPAEIWAVVAEVACVVFGVALLAPRRRVS